MVIIIILYFVDFCSIFKRKNRINLSINNTGVFDFFSWLMNERISREKVEWTKFDLYLQIIWPHHPKKIIWLIIRLSKKRYYGHNVYVSSKSSWKKQLWNNKQKLILAIMKLNVWNITEWRKWLNEWMNEKSSTVNAKNQKPNNWMNSFEPILIY